MIKVVIFSGGTGSIALQTGLYKVYGDALKADVIISAYDNGKSTGACRRVFDDGILGPSDLRKNQITRHGLMYGVAGKKKSDIVDRHTVLHDLFEERFTLSGWREAYEYSKTRINEAYAEISLMQGGMSVENDRDLLLSLVDHFFLKADGSPREKAVSCDYTDFSISNMFYAASAAENGNSLGLAGTQMAKVLGIPDSVHLISDVNLYLGALTETGHFIEDEGDIVTWNNPSDKIVDMRLTTAEGQEYIPSVDEGNKTGVSCEVLVRDADIIIFSSGTQWSSLIPTYAHKGLRDVLHAANAKKYLVMNNAQDADMVGVNADDLLETVERYLDLSDVTIIMNDNAVEPMSKLTQGDRRAIYGNLSGQGTRKHDPAKLALAIMGDYYRRYIGARRYLFDFDGTIWPLSDYRGDLTLARDNLKSLYTSFADRGAIVSGNSADHFERLAGEFADAAKLANAPDAGVTVYCNGGNCKYVISGGRLFCVGNLTDEYDLRDDYGTLVSAVMQALNEAGWHVSEENFENRGNCVLSVKPLDRRTKAVELTQRAIEGAFGFAKYTPYANGKTTIDIMNSHYDKKMCVERYAESEGVPLGEIVYVGDNLEFGNDACLMDLGMKTLLVRDFSEFNVFAKTVEWCEK